MILLESQLARRNWPCGVLAFFLLFMACLIEDLPVGVLKCKSTCSPSFSP